MTMDQILFVTVGTTLFDPLVRVASSSAFLKLAKEIGFNLVRIQYGKGEYIPFLDDSPVSGIKCESYRFKPSLQDDVQAASLIISHAGAGSIMEALIAGKKILVVINDTLMHNHQWEVALALAHREYLRYAHSPSELLERDGQLIKDVSSTQYVPRPFPKGDMKAFPKLLDDLMGYSD